MENRVKHIERWETSDGRWFELLTTAHDHQEKLVDMADELERLQRERDELAGQVELTCRAGKLAVSERNDLVKRVIQLQLLVGDMQIRESRSQQRVNDLQAIVAELPMCWQLKGEGDERELKYDFVIIRPVKIWMLGGMVPREECTDGDIGWCPSVKLVGGGFVNGKECYNSLEAAEFAKQAEGTE